MYEILKTVNSPEDVKKLSSAQLETLAEDIRAALFNRLTKIGGHCGPNFGIVETTIANPVSTTPAFGNRKKLISRVQVWKNRVMITTKGPSGSWLDSILISPYHRPARVQGKRLLGSTIAN